jgi:hypothetical protein
LGCEARSVKAAVTYVSSSIQVLFRNMQRGALSARVSSLAVPAVVLTPRNTHLLLLLCIVSSVPEHAWGAAGTARNARHDAGCDGRCGKSVQTLVHIGSKVVLVLLQFGGSQLHSVVADTDCALAAAISTCYITL